MVQVAALSRAIDPMRCMGRWHVQLAVPTALDGDAHNAIEEYEWDEANQRIGVTYSFLKGSFEGKESKIYQRGWVKSDAGTTWHVSPYLGFFYLPVKLPYLIVDVDAEYTKFVASSPATTGKLAWLYFMTRDAVADEATLEWGRSAAAAAGWDGSRLVRVPQQPRAAGRAARRD